VLRRLGRLVFKLIPLWSGRVFLVGSLLALVLVGSVILGLRYWILPNADSYRGNLESALTRATGQRVTIGDIQADWQGLRPQVSLGAVTVYDRNGKPALQLDRVDSALSWLSLLFFEPRFYSLEINSPNLAVRRAADGTISVAGIDLASTEGGGGLSDWVLRQREIVVKQAVITWVDEKMAAPELRLTNVTLRLQNDLHRHRFGLRATAPEHLAGPLDVRGDLAGRSVQRLHEWEGQFFVQLDYTDLAAWKQWLTLPIEIEQGSGALRMWVDVGAQRVTGVVADVRLARLKTRLADDLEMLELGELSGRVGWRSFTQGYEVSTRQLSAVVPEGQGFAPFDLNLRRYIAANGKPARGELTASALDLDAMARLAEHLPIDAGVRAELKRYAPRGNVDGLTAKWSGDWPPTQFELKAKFAGLGLNAVDAIPAFTNLSGQLDATEKRGSIVLTSQGVQVDLPTVLAEALKADDLAGQIAWISQVDKVDVRLSEIKFANADLAGTLQGTYQSVPGKRGIVDLTGALTRADARAVARYLPVKIGKATREWLQGAVIAGQSNDVKLRLKGDLADFPFEGRGKGIFEVTAKATGGALDYAPGWPRLENISASLAFTGTRMEIRSTAATILGAQVPKAVAVIADLNHANEVLEVTGDAEGPTAEFLRFVAESPVAGMIDRFTDGMEAQGRGRLGLKLTLPLRSLKDTRVAGGYQFFGNRLRVDPDLPPLEQVNGRIDFTESTVRGQGIAAQMFGGPATINVATQEGAVDLTATGRANADILRKLFDGPVWQTLSGSAEWRSTMRVRAKLADFVIESNLVGLASSLPAPLTKSANDALPLRLERRSSGRDQDQIDVVLGTIVAASVARRRDGGQMVNDRASVGLGTEAPGLEAGTVRVRGSLPALDVDRWRTVLNKAVAGAVPAGAATVDLKIGSLSITGRKLSDVVLTARSQAGNWRSRVTARELSGDIEWRSQGKGQLIARMQRLALPQAPEVQEAGATGVQDQPADYPALNVVVDDYVHKGKNLGRLELIAIPEGRDWKIERLQLRNPDATFNTDGYWQAQGRAARTQMNLRLEVTDIGKLLARLGYPEGVRGGTANLNGTLSWTGPPQDMDLPSMSGNLMIETGRGQFAKLEPGIGKLLSILSLQALPRRVALDFKDVFSEGFAFDEILGVVKVQKGVASTENFRINGSSAKVSMSGEVDLAHETQKLKVRVTPAVGDSVATVTALLGGPVAGIGVYLAQKLLNDPLGQLIAYDYSVTGTWSDPTVTKLAIDRTPTPEPG